MKNILLIALNFCFYLSSAFAQDSLVELDKNKQYLIIVKDISISVAKIDSLTSHLVCLKDSVANDPMIRAELIKPILNLESQIFEMQSVMEALKSKESLLEQKFLLESAEKTANLGKTVFSSFLLDQQYIKDNITSEELELLLTEPMLDSMYLSSVSQINDMYKGIVKMNDQLKQSGMTAVEADSLKLIIRTQMLDAKDISALFLKDWSAFYSTKIYIYSRLMEKLNTSKSVLESLNAEGFDLRYKALKDKDLIFGGDLLSYYPEKTTSNQYEKIVAAKINELNVVDSINRLFKRTDLVLPANKNIEMADYVYANYQSLVIHNKAKYFGDGTDLPNITVPTVGSIFSIKVIELSKPPTSATNLRKLEPIFRMVNGEKKVEYYTGLYTNRKQAQIDMRKIIRFGFKPKVEEFRKGGKVMPDGSIYPVDSAESLYYVEFKFMDADLEMKLKELAPDKQITVVDGGYTFGVFDNYDELDVVLKNIWVDGTVKKIKK